MTGCGRSTRPCTKGAFDQAGDPVGWHIWHNNSFSPFYRAQQDLKEIAKSSDFLKMVMYHNCGGERMASYIDSVTGTLYSDLPQQELLDFHYRVLNCREGSSRRYHTQDYPRTMFSAKPSVRGRGGGHGHSDLAGDRHRYTNRSEPEQEHAAGHTGCGAGSLQGKRAWSGPFAKIFRDEAREFEGRGRRHQ